MRIRPGLPVGALRPRWSNATILLYSGMLVVLVATLVLLGVLDNDHGSGGVFGWATLALAVATALALALQRESRAIAAGLLAFVAVVLFGVWLGAFLDWVGFFPDWDAFFQPDFEPSLVLLELAVVAVGLVALEWFRFPLLLLPVLFALWYGIVDLDTVFFGDDATNGQRAFLSIVVGLAFVFFGVAVDRRDRALGFWLHLTGGLAVGGALLFYWNSGDGEWLLILLVALAYLGAARLLWRSSYAVYAVIGILAASTHFIGKWTNAELNPLDPILIPRSDTIGPEPGEVHEVLAALLYVAVGLGLLALGLVLERLEGRPRETAAAGPPAEV